MVQSRLSILLAGAAIALVSGLSAASQARDKVTGVPAPAGAMPRVAGVLSLRETGLLARDFEITISNLKTGTVLTDFEEELTQQLHIIAVDSALSTFVHEHAEEADASGRFRVQVQFPKPGTYHVYADAMPAGMGQQVLRFDVPVGQAAAAAQPDLVARPAEILRSSDGPYTVELSISGLAAGRETEMSMRILKDGRPAEDLVDQI